MEHLPPPAEDLPNVPLLAAIIPSPCEAFTMAASAASWALVTSSRAPWMHFFARTNELLSRLDALVHRAHLTLRLRDLPTLARASAMNVSGSMGTRNPWPGVWTGTRDPRCAGGCITTSVLAVSSHGERVTNYLGC